MCDLINVSCTVFYQSSILRSALANVFKVDLKMNVIL